jgi:hypothetical protein
MKNTILKITITMLIMVLAGVAVYAEDAPVELGLDISSTTSFDTVGTDVEGWYGYSDIYDTKDITGTLSVPLGMYTLGFYAYDSIELFVDMADATTGVTSTDFANFFSLGWTNDISIENALDINVSLDFGVYVDSRLGNGVGGSGLELDLTPSIGLSGEYDFGLSWGIAQAFYLYFQPALAKPFTGAEIEGDTSLSFSFMQYVTEAVGGSVDFNFYNDIVVPSKGATSLLFEITLGASFDIYGFAPSIGFFTGLAGSNAITTTDIGLYAGLGYSKDWFSVGVSYIGAADAQSTTTPEWKNYFEGSFGISL